MGAGWYAFALLTAPVITTLSLLTRSTPPAIATASDKLGLLHMGVAIGLGSSPFFEEVGWTGFAIPALLQDQLQLHILIISMFADPGLVRAAVQAGAIAVQLRDYPLYSINALDPTTRRFGTR